MRERQLNLLKNLPFFAVKNAVLVFFIIQVLKRIMKRSRCLFVNWKAVDGAIHGKRKLAIRKNDQDQTLVQ